MAARGYFETHNLVKHGLVRAIKGENAGTVFRQALPQWYRALFSPRVQAGIVKAPGLAGYRNDQVFIEALCTLRSRRRPCGNACQCFSSFFKPNPDPRCARARALPLRLHSSLHGWQWPPGEIPDEPDARRAAFLQFLS